MEPSFEQPSMTEVPITSGIALNDISVENARFAVATENMSPTWMTLGDSPPHLKEMKITQNEQNNTLPPLKFSPIVAPTPFPSLSAPSLIKPRLSETIARSGSACSSIDYSLHCPINIGSWCGQRFCDILCAFQSRDCYNSLVEVLLRRYLTPHDWRIMRNVSNVWRQIVDEHAVPAPRVPAAYPVNEHEDGSFVRLMNFTATWEASTPVKPTVSWCRRCHRWRHNSFNSHTATKSAIAPARLAFTLPPIPQEETLPVSSSGQEDAARSVLKDLTNMTPLDSSSPNDDSLPVSLQVESSGSVGVETISCTQCLQDFSLSRDRQFRQARDVATQDEFVSRCDFCHSAALHNPQLQTRTCWNVRCGRSYCALCLAEPPHDVPKSCCRNQEDDTNDACASGQFLFSPLYEIRPSASSSRVIRRVSSGAGALTADPLPFMAPSSTPIFQRGSRTLQASKRMLKRL